MTQSKLRAAATTTLCVGSLLLTTGAAAGAQAAKNDESPRINDRATLLGGQVIRQGQAAHVDFRLRCPKGSKWTAEMFLVTANDTMARTSSKNPPSGTCTGTPTKTTLTLRTDGTAQLPRDCSAEYGVTFTGRRWNVAFDRGGADGGPDGPGPRLCLR